MCSALADIREQTPEMRAGVAVTLNDVSKIYRMYSNPTDRALDVLGLSRFTFWRNIEYQNFPALDAISLTVAHGERIGLVGANGAGKTTLLKLLTGNFAGTSGTVEVDGRVQALMQVGLGFHPEFTGYENVCSSLLYNGLEPDQLEDAAAEVIDFVELGDFIHQPVKTYSLGMRARLQFATATAIRPDILIIDEVLGAGDAYFAAKSSDRMEKLTRSGCTLLLVSHSMQQVLQFCERVVWLDAGRIVEDGDALSVVRDYEAHIHQRRVSGTQPTPATPGLSGEGGAKWQMSAHTQLMGQAASGAASGPDTDISRWAQSASALRIGSVAVLNASDDPCTLFRTGEPLAVKIAITAEDAGAFPCQYVVLIFSDDGKPLVRHLSRPCKYEMAAGETREVTLRYPELKLGAGRFVFSVAIYPEFNLNDRASAQWYDLLSRSFQFEVMKPLEYDPTLFHHPARWDGLPDALGEATE